MMDNDNALHADIAALLPRLRRFAHTLAWRREGTDDLVQLAVERAIVNSAGCPAGTRLGSWLFRIINNAWIDEVRARTRRSERFAPEQEGGHVGDDFAAARSAPQEHLSESARLA